MKRNRTIGAAVVAVSFLMFAVQMYLSWLNGRAGVELSWGTRPGMVLVGIGMLAFSVVGAILVRRVPSNAIGWIFLAIGLVDALNVLANEYAHYGLFGSGGALPGQITAAWVAEWVWAVFIVAIAVFVVLLFPDGRVPGRRWRWVPWTGLVGGLSLAGSLALPPGMLDETPIMNPYGLEGMDPLLEALDVALVLVPISVLGAVLGLVGRFRRSRGVERQQLKWFVAAGGFLGAYFVVLFVFSSPAPGNVDPSAVMEDLFGVALAAIPIAAGVAILRYRLYDIDVLINRTLVYGALSAVLGLAYLGLVTGASSVVGDSPITVAGSTLLVAAMFRPLRGAIQGFIDRRFYRSKYDAERTIAEFSARLRDEVDLETLEAELLEVVHDTVQPVQASLWLRPVAR
ncbi:MAG: hypothetical protein ABR575_06560 [Actinomycetota bacterium]